VHCTWVHSLWLRMVLHQGSVSTASHKFHTYQSINPRSRLTKSKHQSTVYFALKREGLVRLSKQLMPRYCGALIAYTRSPQSMKRTNRSRLDWAVSCASKVSDIQFVISTVTSSKVYACNSLGSPGQVQRAQACVDIRCDLDPHTPQRSVVRISPFCRTYRSSRHGYRGVGISCCLTGL
jgi:hypothetical protein